MRTLFCLAVVMALTAATGQAHYNMLLPATAFGKKGEPVEITYQWGHPFEHQLFDAPKPERLEVRDPNGKKTDLTGSLEKVQVTDEGGKKVTAYRLRFTPIERGDYVFLLHTPPIWMEEEGEFYQDTVKVVLHVQAQKGWDSPVRDVFEWEPLTRPYGLLPDSVYQARIRTSLQLKDERGVGKGPELQLAGALVEVERYNEERPQVLPPDEFITRTTKTDPAGVVTTTLFEPGWWSLTTSGLAGMRDHDGKPRPVRRRSTLWVHVSPKAGR
jgi:uncharacterized GH25 family protein